MRHINQPKICAVHKQDKASVFIYKKYGEFFQRFPQTCFVHEGEQKRVTWGPFALTREPVAATPIREGIAMFIIEYTNSDKQHIKAIDVFHVPPNVRIYMLNSYFGPFLNKSHIEIRLVGGVATETSQRIFGTINNAVESIFKSTGRLKVSQMNCAGNYLYASAGITRTGEALYCQHSC